jgi:hypothetical protein
MRTILRWSWLVIPALLLGALAATEILPRTTHANTSASTYTVPTWWAKYQRLL